MITNKGQVVDRAVNDALIVQRASKRRGTSCPTHPEYVLDGGPIRFHCPAGHSVPAADLDRETHAPLRRVTS